MFKKVLLATDGSKSAFKAAEYAMSIAGSMNAEIIVLYVIDMSLFTGMPTEKAIQDVKEMLISEGKNAFDEINELSKKYMKQFKKEIPITFITKKGHPVDIILKTVDEEEIDLVVMGTSGKHGMDRFMLGSVSEHVVRSSTSSVLVVR